MEQLRTLSLERVAEQWRDILETGRARAHTLVATVADTVVGFASAGPSWSEDDTLVGELYAIYPVPSAQGKGIGRDLIAASTSRLRADGFSEAILWVFEDNPGTRRFYELAGWFADGGRKDEPAFGTTASAVRYRRALGA